MTRCLFLISGKKIIAQNQKCLGQRKSWREDLSVARLCSPGRVRYRPGYANRRCRGSNSISVFSRGELAGTQTATDIPLASSTPLLVGMYANIGIEGMALPGHFVIPVSALRQNNTIWTARSEGTLQVTPVEFVRQEGDMAVLMAPDLAEGHQLLSVISPS